MVEDLTKRLYVENVEDWKKHLSLKKFSDRKLEVKVIERGIILPFRKIDEMNQGGYVIKIFISSRVIPDA